MQQLQLSDRGEGRDARHISCRSTRAQCFTNPNGTTQIYYGGWASPYTDNYATDPFFTTSISQGMADRRAPGTSWKVALTFTSDEQAVGLHRERCLVQLRQRAGAARTPTSGMLDGQYHFSPVGRGRTRALLRYRYTQRTLSNTFCGAAGTTSCPPGSSAARRARRLAALQVQPSTTRVRLLNRRRSTRKSPGPGAGHFFIKAEY